MSSIVTANRGKRPTPRRVRSYSHVTNHVKLSNEYARDAQALGPQVAPILWSPPDLQAARIAQARRGDCLCYFLSETPSKILLATGWPLLNAGMNFQSVVDFKSPSSTD